jgi:hypothetical protein
VSVDWLRFVQWEGRGHLFDECKDVRIVRWNPSLSIVCSPAQSECDRDVALEVRIARGLEDVEKQVVVRIEELRAHAN